VKLWTGFYCFRIEPSGWLLWTQLRIFGLHKRREIFGPAKRQSAFQEAFWSIELVNFKSSSSELWRHVEFSQSVSQLRTNQPGPHSTTAVCIEVCLWTWCRLIMNRNKSLKLLPLIPVILFYFFPLFPWIAVSVVHSTWYFLLTPVHLALQST